MSAVLIDKLRAVVGAANVLTEGDLGAWEQDWRKRSRGKALAVVRPGSTATLPDLPIGSRVRILPNHACATGAQHEVYHVIESGSRAIATTWPRMRGW